MFKLLGSISIFVVFSGLNSVATAQGINLDIGRWNAEPSPNYGAAAGQVGVWNRLVVTAGGPLVDIHGAATSASVSTLVQHHFDFGFDNPLTFGDDELLLDGGHDNPMTLEFLGLQNGDYFVYTYAFAPDDPVHYFTNVAVTQSNDPMQLVGGADWSGIHVQGVTYAKHRATVTNGSLQIVCTIGNLYATVNGVQLEPTLPLPMIYCTAKTNSLGCTPTMSSTGVPSATSGSGFTIQSAQNRNDKAGLLLYSLIGRASVPFAGGVLCLSAPVNRTIGLNSYGTTWPAADCTGVFAIDMNAFAVGSLGGAPLPELSMAGVAVDCQFWGRDPGYAYPDNASLSEGLEYTIGP